MRSLFSDRDYFAFLDAACADQDISIALIPALLVREFPLLRAEEAKAIYADWYAQRRQRNVPSANAARYNTHHAIL